MKQNAVKKQMEENFYIQKPLKTPFSKNKILILQSVKFYFLIVSIFLDALHLIYSRRITMGLFDRKNCDICGGKPGLLGGKKVEDGVICGKCAKKLSPWAENRRHSTLEDIKKQLAYREENKARIANFSVTRSISSDSYTVFINDNTGEFVIGHDLSEDENPDIVKISQVTSCRLDMQQYKKRIEDKDAQGNVYNVRNEITYDFKMLIGINSPYFDDMDFQLNSFSVQSYDQGKIFEYQNIANQIVNALKPAAMNNGMNMGMNNGMMNNGMNNGMMNGMMNNGMNMGMNNGMNNTPAGIVCPNCGWRSPDPAKQPKFCPSCGSKL